MCTTIQLQTSHGIWVANNEDIFLETGMIFTNQRGIHKVAAQLPPEIPASWVSVYGSLIFSQSGKEFPSGGINEAGLVVEQMTLPETQYPAADARSSLSELQLIQLLLDTCQTVEESLAAIKRVRITNAAVPIHYMICDPEGDVAVVEFLDSELISYQGADLPVRVLANSNYSQSLAYRNHEQSELPVDDYQQNSLLRYTTATQRIEDSASFHNLPVDAFTILDAVRREDTIWQIVYDLGARTIYFKTRWSPAIKSIDLNDIDFSIQAIPQVFDMRQVAEGDIQERFIPYTAKINRELIDSFFGNPIIQQILNMEMPEEILAGLAAYPDQLLAK